MWLQVKVNDYEEKCETAIFAYKTNRANGCKIVQLGADTVCEVTGCTQGDMLYASRIEKGWSAYVFVLVCLYAFMFESPHLHRSVSYRVARVSGLYDWVGW